MQRYGVFMCSIRNFTFFFFFSEKNMTRKEQKYNFEAKTASFVQTQHHTLDSKHDKGSSSFRPHQVRHHIVGDEQPQTSETQHITFANKKPILEMRPSVAQAVCCQLCAEQHL